MSDALVRRIGLGITLAANEGDGVNYVALGAIVDGFDHDGASLDVADTSILADRWKTKQVGQADPGKISLTIAYDPTVTTTTAARLSGMLYGGTTGVSVATGFQITYPAVGSENVAITENFSGYVTKLGRQIKKDKLIVAQAEITITGAPGIAGH